MLYILTIVIGKIIHACICNLKWISNIDVQQDYLTKMDKIWLLVKVSFIKFFGRKSVDFH